MSEFTYKRMCLYVNHFENKNSPKTHKFAYKPMRLWAGKYDLSSEKDDVVQV